MLRWSPQLPPVVSGLILIGAAAFVVALYGRISLKMSRRRTLMVLAPKAATLALLAFALFDPAWTQTRQLSTKRHLVIVTDISSSMDVRDGEQTRAERAANIVREVQKALQGLYSVRRLVFDTGVHEADMDRSSQAAELRETDLGGCLLALAEKKDLPPEGAVVLVTDGGDEPVEPQALPVAPLYVVGMGSDPAGWLDISLSDVEYPPSVEKGVDFDVHAEVTVRTPAGHESPPVLRVRLERRDGGSWTLIEEKKVRTSGRVLRVSFRTNCAETQTHTFRVHVEGDVPEMSKLNNQRSFQVEARRKQVHVLYFTRELGTELKMIRNELAADPGLTFTALFRTIGERFTVQGERLEGDEELQAGFPTDVRILRLYDCVILGSFPASDWTTAQMDALVEYVRGGGSVIFLGGESSFDLGNYGPSPLSRLIPWEMIPGERDLIRGELPVSMTDIARGHPMMSGLYELVGNRATVSAANRVGPLRPGAIVLMNVAVAGRVLPLMVWQRYGEGAVLAIATNTLWKWGRESTELQKAYGLFWRQAVRNLAGREEGGRILSVRWDKPQYRPGEQASVELRVAGREEEKGLGLTASLTVGADSRPLPIEPVQGVRDTWYVRVRFRERGLYRFALTAQRDGRIVETYEKDLRVGPALPEGARLETDHRFLASLAERGGGLYVPEADFQKLLDHLRRTAGARALKIETPLVSGQPWFAIAVLTFLVAEWIIRRSLGLL